MEKGKLKKILQKKAIYKEALGIITAVGIVTFISKGIANQKNEFDTYKGKRDLKDYEDFLEEHDIDYRNTYAKAEGDLVKIFVKTPG